LDKLPRFHKPEVLDEHPTLEKAILVALAATAATFVHHRFAPNREAYTYITRKKNGRFGYTVGEVDTPGGSVVGQVFGEYSTKSGEIDDIANGSITIESTQGDINPGHIEQSFRPDIDPPA
jgi:hypothetical protein